MSCDDDDTVNKPSCTRSLQIVSSSISATIIQQAPGRTNLLSQGSSCAGSCSALLKEISGILHQGRQTDSPAEMVNRHHTNRKLTT